MTKTREPKTTRWPAFSVSTWPVLSGFWRDVTMIASSGLATLIPLSRTMTTMIARTTIAAPMMRSVGSGMKGIMPRPYRVEIYSAETARLRRDTQMTPAAVSPITTAMRIT